MSQAIKPLSYSEIRLFYQQPAEWHRRYIDGQWEKPSKQMIYGTIIHEMLATDRHNLRRLYEEEPIDRAFIKRLKDAGFSLKECKIALKLRRKMRPHLLPERELSLTARTKDGLELFIKIDGADLKAGRIDDYKTFTPIENKTGYEKWNQWIVDHHKQLSFYAWVWKLTRYTLPSRLYIHTLDITNGTIKHYPTARGPYDIQFIEDWTRVAVKRMKDAGLWELRLSRKERERRRNGILNLSFNT